MHNPLLPPRSLLPTLMKRLLALALLALLSSVRIETLFAQSHPWPNFRGDERLSGRAKVTGPFNQPELLWQKPLGNKNLSSVVAEDGTVIFTGNEHTTIYFLNAITGNTIRTFARDYIFYSTPSLSAQTLFIGGRKLNINPPEDSLLAIGIADARRKWAVKLGGRVSHSAIVDDSNGRIYVVTDNGELSCLIDEDKTAQTIWTKSLNGIPPNSSPVINQGGGDRIYVPTDAGLFVYNSNGDAIHIDGQSPGFPWQYPDVSFIKIGWAALAPGANENLYLGASDISRVIRVHAKTGKFNRDEQNPSDPLFTQMGPLRLPAFRSDGKLVVTDFKTNQVVIFKPDLKEFDSQSVPGNRLLNLPVIDEKNRIYLVSDDKNVGLFALDASGNFKVIEASVTAIAHDAFAQSPAFGKHGELYVVSNDTIFAVREKPYPNSLTLLSPTNPIGCIDSTLAVRVMVKDQYEKGMTGISVKFQIESGGGKINDDSGLKEVLTNNDGEAAVSWRLGSLLGKQRLIATIAEKNDTIRVVADARAPEIGGNTMIEFGAVEIGQSPTLDYPIQALGNCDLTITAFDFRENPSDYKVLVPDQLPHIIDAGGTWTIQVVFTPTAEDERPDMLYIESSDASQSPFEVELKGVGKKVPRPGCLRVKSAEINFDAVCIGANHTREDTLYNVCEHEVTVEFTTTAPQEFKPVQSLISIPANSAMPYKMLFCPNSVGDKSAQLTIRRVGTNESLLVALKGTGITASIGGTESFDFGSVLAYKRKDSSYSFFNTSSCILTIGGITLTDENADEFRWHSDIVDRPIPPDSSGQITISFCPTSVGTKSAQLILTNKFQPTDRRIIELSGTAGDNDSFVRVKPDALKFGRICLGADMTVTDTLFNESCNDLQVTVTPTNAAFEPEQDMVFVPAQGHAALPIRFRPINKQPYSALLKFSIETRIGNKEMSIPLIGEGIAAEIEGEGQFNFNLTALGSCSPDTFYPFQNAGACTLSVDSLRIFGQNSNSFEIVGPSIIGKLIPPNGSNSVGLKFCPKQPGENSASLRIFSNDLPLPGYFEVALFGTTDTTAPRPPRNIRIFPEGWTCEDKLKICWENPLDESGIDSAFYKIGAPPGFNYDTTGAFKLGDSACIDLVNKLVTSGRHPVYVWLSDRARNKDFRNNAVVTAKLDNTPPIITFKQPPPEQAQMHEEILFEVIVSDEHSGIMSGSLNLRYRRGGEPDAYTMVAPFDADGEATIPSFYVNERGVEYAIEVQDNACKAMRWLNNKAFKSIRVQVPEERLNVLHLGGLSSASYKAHGVPLEMFNTGITEIFDPVAVDVKDKKAIRIWEIDSLGAQSDFPFREYITGQPFKGLTPGHAILLITKNTIALQNSAGLTIPTTEPFVFRDLHEGCNLITSPFSFEIPIENLSLAKIENLRAFDGTWQVVKSGFKLKPWEGYLVRIDPGDNKKLTLMPSEEIKRRVPPNSRATPDWQIEIVASNSGMKDRGNFVGVASDAVEEWDEHELFEAPRLGDYLRLYFDQAHWQKAAGFYATDFRPPAEVGYEWKFCVESASEHRVTELEFSALPTVPNDYAVILYDVTQGRSHDLRVESRYRFPSPMPSTNLFKLWIGSEAFVNDRVTRTGGEVTSYTLEQNYPNPFNPTTSLRFALAETGPVSLAIYNLKGELVRTLFDGKVMSVGVHQETWDGKDEFGNTAANGVYFCRMQAGQKTLLRKLTLLK